MVSKEQLKEEINYLAKRVGILECPHSETKISEKWSSFQHGSRYYVIKCTSCEKVMEVLWNREEALEEKLSRITKEAKRIRKELSVLRKPTKEKKK